MKVSFLNPPRYQRRLNEDLTINFNVSRFSRGVDLVYGVTPPTELAILAAKVAKTHKVDILDANALNMLPRDVNRWIMSNRPDFLVLKCGDTTLIDDLVYYYFAEGIGVKTIVWEDMLNPVFTDDLIRSYSLKRILYGEPEDIIEKFLAGNEGAFGGDTVSDINTLPQPLMKKLPMDKYVKEGRKTWYSFLSRGCGYGKCEFCLMAASDLPQRLRSIEHIKEELDMLQSYAYDSIYFWDPQFNPSLGRASEVAQLMGDYPFTWECWFRCDHVDDDLIALMKRSGCFRIHIGMENGSQKVHDSYKKGVKVEDIRRTVSLANKHGIETAAYLVLGTPEESRETFKETVRLIKEAKPTTIIPSSFRPFPNVPLTRKMQQENMLDADHFSLSGFSECFGFSTVTRTKHLSKVELADEIQKIHRLSTKLAVRSYAKKPKQWKALVKPFLLRTLSNHFK